MATKKTKKTKSNKATEKQSSQKKETKKKVLKNQKTEEQVVSKSLPKNIKKDLPGFDINIISKFSNYLLFFAVAVILGFFIFSTLSPDTEDPDPENINWITYQNNPLCGEVKENMTIKTFTIEYNNKFVPRDCTELPIPSDQEISPIYVVFYDLKDDDGEFSFVNIKESLGLMSFNTEGSIINEQNYTSLESDFNRMTNVYLEQFDSSDSIESRGYEWKEYKLLSRDSLAKVDGEQFLVRTIMMPKLGTDQGFFVFSIKQFENGDTEDQVRNEMSEGDVQRMIQSIDLGLEGEADVEEASTNED